MKVQKYLNELKMQLSGYLYNSDNKDWGAIKVEINFPPFISRGLQIAQYVEDKQGQKLQIRLMKFDQIMCDIVYSFIFKFNQEGEYNQIIFKAQQDKLDDAMVEVRYNEDVEEAFLNNLPKSKQGKTIPWWKNPNETKDLV